MSGSLIDSLYLMPPQQFEISQGIRIGGGLTPVLFAGPCVIESEAMALRHAEQIARIAGDLGMPYVFKASYDKANRTSLGSFRGPGLKEGLRILARVGSELAIPLITDAHSVEEMKAAGEVVDVVQVPAFLCRQTDLLVAAAKTGRAVNVKKGQFLSPDDIPAVIEKVRESGCKRLMITERGVTFGYQRLVVDFAGVMRMREYGCPIVFDATHSVMRPGAGGDHSEGDRQFAPFLAWAAAAVGIDGLFIETHEDPSRAPSDGQNMIPLSELRWTLERFLMIASLHNP